jgi:ferredoxin-NADP reductase
VARALDAATAPHGIDRYIELVSPTWSTTEVRGRIVGVVRQTSNTVTLTVEANRNWHGFVAGQYTQLTVEIDGVRHTRCYSMATSATASGRQFELTVKAHPNGLVSNHLVSRARPGMVVGLTPAQGDFTLPGQRPERVLLISGGSGITPVLSMLRTLCAEGHSGPVTFVHYCLTAGDLTYGAELSDIASRHPNVRVIKIFTDEPGAGDFDGFVSVAQLDAIDASWRQAETYMCGPAPLMSAAAAIYAEADLGIRLHTEAFTLSQWIAEAPDVSGAIRFTGSGTEVRSDGRTILDQAEGAGLTPKSGCRMGICHSCICPLVSGTVRNVVTGVVTADRGQDIQICINAPVGDVEIDL